MKLEDIGFYTLSNNRACNSTHTSPLMRCEMILTDRCNFKCSYCRPLISSCRGDIPFEKAKRILKIWFQNGLKNIRFSGGEPTLYKELNDLILMCKDNGVERIAISTNGSNSLELYNKLINSGLNDISISLDSCCSSVGNLMAGGVKCWVKVVENIKALSKLTYVSVGMVFTEQNIHECLESVMFADTLGVSDIRVIPSAQYNKALKELINLPENVLNKYPILKYRINNTKHNVAVRGIKDNKNRCWLAIDDMAVAGPYHFPCIIYLREGGEPIGKINENVRAERLKWIENHKPWEDKICLNNCLDCLVLYNELAERIRK